MPKQKQKTNKAAKKRFKVTATGKILYQPAGRRHLLSAKNAKKRRQSRRWRSLTGAHDVRKMHIILGTGRMQHRSPEKAASPLPEPQKG